MHENPHSSRYGGKPAIDVAKERSLPRLNEKSLKNWPMLRGNDLVPASDTPDHARCGKRRLSIVRCYARKRLSFRSRLLAGSLERRYVVHEIEVCANKVRACWPKRSPLFPGNNDGILLLKAMLNDHPKILLTFSPPPVKPKRWPTLSSSRRWIGDSRTRGNAFLRYCLFYC